MSITFENIVSALDQIGTKHFADRGHEAAIVPYRTPAGDLHVQLALEADGQFISLACNLDIDAETHEMLRRICESNGRHRLVQVGTQDGRVRASAGLWIMDGRLTPKMLGRFLENFIAVATIMTGELRGITAGTKLESQADADAGTWRLRHTG